MRLESITIENYRSIRSARKVAIKNFTTLLGPNNEGKSNTLNALRLGMWALKGFESVRYRSSSSRMGSRVILSDRNAGGFYDWFSDFPLSLQSKKPNSETKVTLEFQFTDSEVAQFVASVGSNLNGLLTIQFSFGRSTGDYNVVKQGRGFKTLNSKKDKIREFLASRINFLYVPAVRTASDVENIVSRLVERELRPIEVDPTYLEAIERIRALQEPILSSLSSRVTSTIRVFLPDIKSVRVENTSERRLMALRSSIEVHIDDGVDTSLKNKGDGIQSLVALAMMQHSSGKTDVNMNSIIALEEPESHLHPKAIHQLRGILEGLSTNSQVIVTTHNPIFVNRHEIRCNVIVNDNRATPAKNLNEIREVLGVQVQDNLRSAELILVVEGSEDEVALRSLLSNLSETLKSAIDSGRLGFDALGGASKLHYKVGLHKAQLSQVHAFLDDDRAGMDAAEKCLKDTILLDGQITYAALQGRTNSEFEDLVTEEVINSALQENQIVLAIVKDNQKTWSERLEISAKSAGLRLSSGSVTKVKYDISALVGRLGAKAINPRAVQLFNALVRMLESKLRK